MLSIRLSARGSGYVGKDADETRQKNSTVLLYTVLYLKDVLGNVPRKYAFKLCRPLQIRDAESYSFQTDF